MDMSNISSSSPSLSASVFKDPGVVAELVVTPEELVGARLFPPSIFTEEDTAGNERKEQNEKKRPIFSFVWLRCFHGFFCAIVIFFCSWESAQMAKAKAK